jgi:dienelactone hydrolase
MNLRSAAWLLLVPGAMGLPLCAREPDLHAPPAIAPTNAPALSNLLLNSRGELIRTRGEWSRQREVIRQQWSDVLGALPRKRPPLATEVLATESIEDFTRQHVRYQVESGVFTDGYLLKPKNARGKLPAVVVFHPTTPLHAKGVAGVAIEYPAEKWHGVQLVRRGYVVWCPRNYINTEGADWKGNAQRVMERRPGWTGMARMVWDAVRAADFVASLPDVDAARIGCLGHSLGGKQVLYAMAFDERYRAGVSSEGGIGLTFSNWDALWYLGPQIRAPDFALENHQVLALIAPRAFLLIAGDSADGDRSWPFIQAAMPVYQLHRAEKNLGWFNHHLGHSYPPEARAMAENFLDQHLKR